MITGVQLRMARAALQITVEEMAALTGLDKGTIVRIEAGRNAYSNTLRAVQSALEAEGLIFLDEDHGVHGPAVAFRWGIEEQRKRRKAASVVDGDDGDAAEGKAWDADARDREMPDTDRATLRHYFDAHPERWARLSPAGKAVLMRAMGTNDAAAGM